MQQRQLRLGDILDDYCTRERRLTNHAVVAMVGADVKQTRCTTCDTEHEYKHAKVPRQRRKSDSPAALYAQVAAGAPKRVHAPAGTPAAGGVGNASPGEHDDDLDVDAELVQDEGAVDAAGDEHADDPEVPATLAAAGNVMTTDEDADGSGNDARKDDEGPVHRPLIRASLPREGQPPSTRPIPEFTIRQPGGRPNRFRSRGGPRGPFQGDRSNGNGPGGFGGPRNAGPRHQGGGRPPQGAMAARRHGPGRKRQK
jgi:hypothetical protein